VPDELVTFFVYQDQFVFSKTFNALFNLVGLDSGGIASVYFAGGDKFPILDIPDPGKAPTRCTPIGMHDFIGGMHAIAMEAVLSVEPIVASGLVSNPGPDQLLSQFLIGRRGFVKPDNASGGEQAAR
jgi:hypothetical protein